MQATSLNSLIESMVQSLASEADAQRQRHLLRQALLALVRQAQAEQIVRVRRAPYAWLASVGAGSRAHSRLVVSSAEQVSTIQSPRAAWR